MEESLYHGFKRIDWKLGDYNATLVFPDKPAPGNRWIWRAEFLGAFDTADVEMLKRGWYLAYYQISDMYGSPQAVRLMDDFYRFVTERYGLSERTVLFGFSRGGLYSISFAGAYPERVGGLYLDAPAIDIFWWPCRKEMIGDEEYDRCRKLYGFETGADHHPDNPFHKIDSLIENKLPLAIVAGLADEAVPYETCAKVIVDKYAAAGLDSFLVLKPGCAHHPHSLKDPTALADYIVEKM